MIKAYDYTIEIPYKDKNKITPTLEYCKKLCKAEFLKLKTCVDTKVVVETSR